MWYIGTTALLYCFNLCNFKEHVKYLYFYLGMFRPKINCLYITGNQTRPEYHCHIRRQSVTFDCCAVDVTKIFNSH